MPKVRFVTNFPSTDHPFIKRESSWSFCCIGTVCLITRTAGVPVLVLGYLRVVDYPIVLCGITSCVDYVVLLFICLFSFCCHSNSTGEVLNEHCGLSKVLTKERISLVVTSRLFFLSPSPPRRFCLLSSNDRHISENARALLIGLYHAISGFIYNILFSLQLGHESSLYRDNRIHHIHD